MARELSADRQSESDALIVPAMGAGLELHEGTKIASSWSAGMPIPCRAPRFEPTRRRNGTRCHAAAAVRELDRVGGEVHQNLIHLFAVCADD
jgi:hypothetical protein